MPVIPSNQPIQPAQQSPTQPEGRRERGTGFTNIGKLLGANVGAGQTMGQGLGATIGQKAGQVSQDVSKAGAAFQSKFGEESQKQQQALSNVSGLLNPAAGTVNPNLSSLSGEQATQLGKGLSETKYAGPTELENKQQLLSRAGAVQNLGQLASSGVAGQGLLLQNAANRQNPYTRGQGTLDKFLLGQSKEAQQAIQQGASQALSTQQQAQNTANLAEQQAKGAQSSIEAQKADITKNVLGNISNVQGQGTEQAKSFLGEADRVKKLLTDPTEKGYVTDQSGNKYYDANQALKDQQLLGNLGKYGIDLNSEVYAADSSGNTSELDAYIQSLANTGNTTFAGQTLYTPEQQSALRNLALISGQPELAQSAEAASFASPFSVNTKEIQQSGLVNERQNQIGALESFLGTKGADESKAATEKYNSGANAFNQGNRGTEMINNDFYNGDREASFKYLLNHGRNASTNENSFITKAYDLLGPGRLNQIYNAVGLGATTPYRVNKTMDAIKQAYDAKLAEINKLNNIYSSKTSIQDYINKKFGITPQG
jgi:hypothetical protein